MEPVKTSSVSPAVQRQVAVASSLPIVTKTSRNSVQPSLKVSSPTDSAEVEAVHVAKKIMRTQISSHEVPNTQPATAGKVFRLKTNGKEGKIQRQGEGTPQVSAGLSSQIQNSSSEGSPLPVPVRGFMEPRFQADFSNVKIHTSESSASMNSQLSAKAFTVGNQVFFGKDQFRPDHDDGKELIAHELTHTIQQGAAIQRSEDTAVTQTSGVKVQRLGLSDALDYFADKANLIPGFRMFTIILGVNPINMSAVSRNAANILRAIIELLPGGALITQALDNHGIIDKVAGWIEQQINTLGMTGSIIKAAISKFLDSLSWRDIFDLGGVWNRAKRIFTEPIDRIISFGKGLITGIIKFIKEAILRPLAKLAEGTAGYDLLKAVLGEDPVTGDPVPRNADTLIGGFMKLIGQQEVWENIKKGNAIAKAWAWFQNALKDLMGFVKQIPSLFVKAFTSLELMDIILVPRAFAKIISVFGSFMGQFLSWAGNTVISLLQIIFEVVAPKAVPYLNKAVSTFKIIIKEPIKFVGNLVKAGKQGFQMFADNILEHLKTALINWIVGPLGEAGVYIPKSFTLIEVVKLVLSILGLTWQNIRSKLVKIIPEPVMVVLEKSAGILVTLITQGPAAAWEQIKAELTELKDQLISQVTQMITTEVVKAATIKLVSMLNPAGAVIQAIIAIYDTVTFFIDKAKQIAAVVASFIDSVSEIASGQVATAAKAVEKTMANTLTVVLAFLAKFVGLGKVPDKLVGIIKKIRQPIDKGLDRIVGWLGSILDKIVGKVKQAFNWLFAKKSFTDDEGKAHNIFVEVKGSTPVLQVASTVMEADAYLGLYQRNKGVDFVKKNQDKINTAKSSIDKAKKLIADIEKLKGKNPYDPAIAGLQAQLAAEIAKASKALSEMKGGKLKMAKVTVTFANDRNFDSKEFARQIKMQHDRINQLKISEWLVNRQTFVTQGRTGDSEKTKTRGNYIDTEANRIFNIKPEAPEVKYIKSLGITSDKIIIEQLKDLVKGTLKGKAVLHTVDQVAGGSGTEFGDSTGIFGASNINSSIGPQWTAAERLGKIEKEVAEVSPDVYPKEKMLIDLFPK